MVPFVPAVILIPLCLTLCVCVCFPFTLSSFEFVSSRDLKLREKYKIKQICLKPLGLYIFFFFPSYAQIQLNTALSWPACRFGLDIMYFVSWKFSCIANWILKMRQASYKETNTLHSFDIQWSNSMHNECICYLYCLTWNWTQTFQEHMLLIKKKENHACVYTGSLQLFNLRWRSLNLIRVCRAHCFCGGKHTTIKMEVGN